MKKIQCVIILFLSYQWSMQAQIIDFTYNPHQGCDSALVTLTNACSIAKEDTSDLNIQWSFGNGESYLTTYYYRINPPTPVFYKNPGKYLITLSVSGKFGTLMKSHEVIILDSPNPFFQIFDTITGTDTAYSFRANNTTLPDSCYTWYFPGVDTVVGPRFVKKFDVPAVYPVMLVIIDTTVMHCKSEFMRTLHAFKKLNVYNVVIPYGASAKDTYFSAETNGTTEYRLNIYSRNGLLIFQSEGTRIFWDGYLYSGEMAKPGTYFFTIETISGAIDYTEKGYLYVVY